MSGLQSNDHIFNSARGEPCQDYCRMIIFLTVHEENHKDVTAVNLILNEKSGRRIYNTDKKKE